MCFPLVMMVIACGIEKAMKKDDRAESKDEDIVKNLKLREKRPTSRW